MLNGNGARRAKSIWSFVIISTTPFQIVLMVIIILILKMECQKNASILDEQLIDYNMSHLNADGFDVSASSLKSIKL